MERNNEGISCCGMRRMAQQIPRLKTSSLATGTTVLRSDWIMKLPQSQMYQYINKFRLEKG